MKTPSIALTRLLAFMMVWTGFLGLPSVTWADTNARLGGGNALLRASTGMTNASIASDILSRLTFAAAHGGQPDDVPPTDTQEIGDRQSETQANENANQNATSSTGSNGGTSAANGGNGGDGGPSGLIRAGSVVSNSTAINAINTTIIRIGR